MVKAKKFLFGIALVWASLGPCGCQNGRKVDSISIGTVVREVSGHNGIFRVRKKIPSYRIQLNKWESDKIDSYLRIDYNEGKLNNVQFGVPGNLEGNLLGVGAGINVFPLSRNISLDLGAEVFYSDFVSESRFGILKFRVEDTVLGWGINAGATGNFPLNDRISFFVTGGYNFSDNESDKTHVDFDGPYYGAGFRFKIGK